MPKPPALLPSCSVEKDMKQHRQHIIRDAAFFQSPMYSTLDALGPTLYRIAWYKLEWPHDGGV